MTRVKIAGIVLLAGLSVLIQNAHSVPTAMLPENYSAQGGSSSGGSGSQSLGPNPQPACEIYNLVIDAAGQSFAEYNPQNAANYNGNVVLTGPASELNCLANAITWCSEDQSAAGVPFVSGIYDGTIHSAWNSNGDYRIWQGDDCIGLYLSWQGKVRSQYICTSFAGCGTLVDSGSYLFDANCDLVSNPSSGDQCSINYTYWWSPISLLWEEGVDISDKLSIVQFPLNIGDSKQWYTWKASAETPLLVYDPEHRGQVTSPAQLFGNWTFGGQRTAFSGGPKEILPRPWKDGYEALATLDVERDGELSGDELVPLALWFDKNQDGKSQAGEVTPVTNLGVSKIFVAPNRRDPVSNEIYADRGFERRTNEGKTLIGKSVDWLGESFSNPLEGVAMMQARSVLQVPAAAPRGTAEQPHFAASKRGKLSGIWRWQTESADPESRLTSGVLSLSDDGRNVSGQAYVEVPLKKRQGRVARIVKRNEIQGRHTVSAKGEVILRLTLKDGSTKSVSEATLSPDGLELRGHTTSFVKVKGATTLVPVKYNWVAKRSV